MPPTRATASSPFAGVWRNSSGEIEEVRNGELENASFWGIVGERQCVAGIDGHCYEGILSADGTTISWNDGDAWHRESSQPHLKGESPDAFGGSDSGEELSYSFASEDARQLLPRCELGMTDTTSLVSESVTYQCSCQSVPYVQSTTLDGRKWRLPQVDLLAEHTTTANMSMRCLPDGLDDFEVTTCGPLAVVSDPVPPPVVTLAHVALYLDVVSYVQLKRVAWCAVAPAASYHRIAPLSQLQHTMLLKEPQLQWWEYPPCSGSNPKCLLCTGGVGLCHGFLQFPSNSCPNLGIRISEFLAFGEIDNLSKTTFQQRYWLRSNIIDVVYGDKARLAFVPMDKASAFCVYRGGVEACTSRLLHDTALIETTIFGILNDMSIDELEHLVFGTDMFD